MAADQFANGRITPVVTVYPGGMRVPAPFVLISVFGDQYIMPRSIGAPDYNQFSPQDSSGTPQWMQRNDFGFMESEEVTVGAGECGGMQGDNWRGFFALGEL